MRYRNVSISVGKRKPAEQLPAGEPTRQAWGPAPQKAVLEADRLQARLLYLQRAPRKAVAGCRGLARYFFAFGGLIMMCAPAVPGYISHGAPGLGEVDSPVVAGVAKGW